MAFKLLLLAVLCLVSWTCSDCRSFSSSYDRSKRIRREANPNETALLFIRAVRAVDDKILDLLGGLENFEIVRQAWEPHSSAHSGYENALHYTNEWLVHIPEDEKEGREEKDENSGAASTQPDRIANETGYFNLGQVSGFSGVYRFIKIDHPAIHHRSARHLSTQLETNPSVSWADQQYSKYRVKRQSKFLPGNLQGINPIDNSIDHLEDVIKYRFNDPLWNKQWYLQSVSPKRSLPNPELQILPVFDMGYTGRGVRVSVLDDGLEHTHKDLRDNYDPQISCDLNDDDKDPMPRYGDADAKNSHGTRCAGEIAMKPNNSICGVGVAPGVRLGGVRMLDGPISDLVEGQALSYASDLVDIYSSSWGPNDDGLTVEGPGRMAQQALLQGIAKGRRGKGIIYVWASGNGGANGDSCACDGYASNIYTLSIGSATQSDSFPWYGEPCPATMAVTYSSGSANDQKVATTDILGACTTSHTGTSASAPLAAGMVALVLEANPSLTWRDVKHLVAWTAQPEPLYKNPGWRKNGAGFQVNERFGFGLMDAYAMVTNARNWSLVPPQRICRATPLQLSDRTFSGASPKKLVFVTDACLGSANGIRRIEHVVLLSTVRYNQRGSLQIDLESPQGTKTRMLFPRPKDNSATGFENWPFVSVHNWGESAAGTWTVTFSDSGNDSSNIGMIGPTDLLLYGTYDDPPHLRSGPRIYPGEVKPVRPKFRKSQDDYVPLTNMQRILRNLQSENWI